MIGIKKGFVLFQICSATTVFLLYFLYLDCNQLKTKECKIEDRPISIFGSSMNDLFKSGDKTFAQMGYYQCHDVTRGEIVLLKRINTNDIMIKTVLMLPGDNFYLRGFSKGFHLIVNNSILLTPKGIPYSFPLETERLLRYFEKNYSSIVPDNLYFVFGTRFNGSTDSSSFGPVYKEELIGRVKL